LKPRRWEVIVKAVPLSRLYRPEFNFKVCHVEVATGTAFSVIPWIFS
jgi:hypothetical protein